MNTPARTFLIIGGGLAGAGAATTLRDEGFDGRVILVGSEPEEPYNRPPLSKEYLRGESDDDAIRVNPSARYREQEIDLRTGVTATRVDAAAQQVELEGGERIGYDALLLATGSEPRTLRLPGAELDGIRYLRTHPDSDRLHADLARKPRVAVVGGGWIGCEVAASARQLGCEVTIVEPQDTLLHAMLGPQLGAIYNDVHRDQGVTVRTGRGAKRIEGAGRAERVVLDDDSTIDCDLVVAGIGAAPRLGLAEAAGLAVENGVQVDGRLAASAPGVFAAGDIARFPNPIYGGRRIRIEHWANALDQGPFAARAMLGAPAAWAKVPYFFSDQYDVGMEFAGDLGDAERVVFRGDPASREFVAFWFAGERLVAGMNVNVWDVSDPIQAIIAAGGTVDERRLLDPDVPIADLAPAG
jgi:3-phenylpropionate/trans-cinnamate dioxygenase ferredoxin reductase component